MAKSFGVGRNIQAKVDDGKLTLTVDLGVDGVPSKSGKSDTIATTGAPQVVGTTPDGKPVSCNVSIFTPASE
jgi:hypothetical protein